MRQPGPDDDQRRGVLTELVAGRAQRGDVGGPQILHLVDEDGDAHAHVACQCGGVEQQFHEVDLDVAGVGAAGLRRDVDAGLPPFPHALVGRGAQSEGLEDAEELVDAFGISMRGRDSTDRHVQRRRQRSTQFLVRPSLDLAGAPSAGDGRRSELVEQYRLPDASQPGENDAAFRSAAGDAFEHDVEGVELLLSTCELGWALAGAGSVGVTHGVHGAKVTTNRAISADI